MSHKARILAAARKQPVDKLPFGARIDVWYNYHCAHDSLPEKYRGCNMVEILRDQGAGAAAKPCRSDHSIGELGACESGRRARQNRPGQTPLLADRLRLGQRGRLPSAASC